MYRLHQYTDPPIMEIPIGVPVHKIRKKENNTELKDLSLLFVCFFSENFKPLIVPLTLNGIWVIHMFFTP